MNSLSIALNYFKLAFSSKMGYIRYIVLPIITVYFIMGMGKAQGPFAKAVVVNMDGSYISEAYIEEIEDRSEIDIIKTFNADSKDQVKEMLTSGEAAISIEIPADFREKVYAGEEAGVEIRGMHGKQYAGMVSARSNQIINKLSYISGRVEESEEAWKAAYEENRDKSVSITTKTIDYTGYKVEGTRLAFGILIMIILNNAIGSVRQMKRDQWNGTYYRICTGPVSPIEYIFGILIYSASLILVQISAAIGIVLTTRGDMLSTSWVNIFLILLAFGIAAVAIALVIVLVAKNSEAVEITVVNITCMISGCFFSVGFMPDFMKNISYIFPQRWALIAIESIQREGNMMKMLQYIGIILGMALAMMLLCTVKMKKNKRIENIVI